MTLEQYKFGMVYYIVYQLTLFCSHNCKQYDFDDLDQNRYFQLKVLKYIRN